MARKEHNPKGVSIRVIGRVQGVGYRAWAADQARTHDLGGWVRNRRDGSVEIALKGNIQSVERIISRLREGPPLARVDDLRQDATSPDDLPDVFEVRPTA